MSIKASGETNRPRFQCVVKSLNKTFSELPDVELVVKDRPRPSDEKDVFYFYVEDGAEEKFIEEDFFVPNYFTALKHLDKDSSFYWIPYHAPYWYADEDYQRPSFTPFEERDTGVFGSFGNNGPDMYTEKHIGRTFKELGDRANELSEAEIYVTEPDEEKPFSKEEYLKRMRNTKIFFCPGGWSPWTKRLLEGFSNGCMCLTTPLSEVSVIKTPEPDKHYVEFFSEEEMLEKIEYYLNNEDEAEEIARRGHEFWKEWWRPSGKILNRNLLSLQFIELKKAEAR